MSATDEHHERVNQLARAMIAEWERVEGPVTASYVANFTDMARALMATGLIPEAAHPVAEWRINYGDDEPTKPRPEHWARTHASERHGDIVETRTRTTFPDHYTEWKKADQ